MSTDEQDQRRKRKGTARRFVRAATRGRSIPITAAMLAVAAVIALAAVPRAPSDAASTPVALPTPTAPGGGGATATAAPVPTTTATAPPSGPGESEAWVISPGSTDQVDVTEYDYTAQIEPGTTDTCLLSEKTLFAGPTDDVLPFMNNTAVVDQYTEPMSGTEPVLSVSESDSSPSPGNMDGTMTLSDTVQVDAPQDCAVPAPSGNAALDDMVTFKGRGTLQTAGGRNAFMTPAWLLGIYAELAFFGIYIAFTVAFSVAFAAFFSPAFGWLGEAIGACIGGFVGNLAYNSILGVNKSTSLAAAATSCVVSALEALAFTHVLAPMVKWLEGWRAARLLRSTLQRAGASSNTIETAETSFRSWLGAFDQGVQMAQIPPAP